MKHGVGFSGLFIHKPALNFLPSFALCRNKALVSLSVNFPLVITLVITDVIFRYRCTIHRYPLALLRVKANRFPPRKITNRKSSTQALVLFVNDETVGDGDVSERNVTRREKAAPREVMHLTSQRNAILLRNVTQCNTVV